MHDFKKDISVSHINSGATVHNLLEETVELFIWRKEEEKVLLRMIHTLKLDFMLSRRFELDIFKI